MTISNRIDYLSEVELNETISDLKIAIHDLFNNYERDLPLPSALSNFNANNLDNCTRLLQILTKLESVLDDCKTTQYWSINEITDLCLNSRPDYIEEFIQSKGLTELYGLVAHRSWGTVDHDIPSLQAFYLEWVRRK